MGALVDMLSSRPATTALSTDAARMTVSELLDDHRLTPLERREVSLMLRSAHVGGVGVDLLEYGAPVEIASEGLGYFHLVQIPLRGGSCLRVGDAENLASPAVATLPPLEEDFRLTWEQDAPHLLLYLDHDELVRVAEAASCAEGVPVRLPHQLSLRTDAGRSLLNAVRVLHDALDRPSPVASYALSLASELVMVRLIEAACQEADASTRAGGTLPRGDALFRRFVALAQEMAPLGAGVVDLARVLGVPLRTLQENVRAVSGTTPTAILRDARLHHAHQLLEQADPTRTTVTRIAEQCGFTHLGRFSVDYRRGYGVTPIHTLRSAADPLARFG